MSWTSECVSCKLLNESFTLGSKAGASIPLSSIFAIEQKHSFRRYAFSWVPETIVFLALSSNSGITVDVPDC